MSGRLPVLSSRFENLYWVIRLAGAVEHMLLKNTAKEMREVGRDILTEIAEANLDDVPAEVELGWRVEVLRSKEREEADER